MGDPDPDDAALVLAARRGDRRAFAALLDRHLTLVRALCLRRLADPAAADDTVQDAVVAALTNLDRLRRPESFGPWLAGIALNIARRHDRRAVLPLDAVQMDFPDPRRPPDAVVEARLEAEQLARLVEALPPGQAAAITAYYLQGLTLAETAAHLGTTVAAAKNRLHKARARLRSELSPPTKEQTMIPMTIAGVWLVDDVHIVALSETGGDRIVPIWVGAAEATSLALSLDGADLPRPSTYRLTLDLLEAAGTRVTAVEINALTGGVFYARLTLDGGATVDARPSDALNLAALTPVPIRVDPTVVDEARGSGRDLPSGRSDHIDIAAAAVVEMQRSRK